ncbi:3723_t:CDS:2, partial [Dentiscutata heterogama]
TMLIQSVPVSYSDDKYTLTPEDLLNSSPLLIYSAFVIPNSYIPDNKGGQKSFMKVSLQEDFDTELDNIKEKYATLSHLPQKRQRINMQNSSLNKPSSDKTTSLGFAEVTSQIQKETSSTKSPPLQSTSQAISTEPNTETPIHLVPHVNENTTFTDDNDSTKLAHTNTPVPQNKKFNYNRKCLRLLLPAKK